MVFRRGSGDSFDVRHVWDGGSECESVLGYLAERLAAPGVHVESSGSSSHARLWEAIRGREMWRLLFGTRLADPVIEAFSGVPERPHVRVSWLLRTSYGKHT